MFNSKPNQISDSDWPAAQYVAPNDATIAYMQNKATNEARAAIHFAQQKVREEENRKANAQYAAQVQAEIAAGAVVFKADAGKFYHPTKKQQDYAGKLAREIRDAGIDHSAHSLAKYFTIDTLIEMRNAVKAGKSIVVEF